MTDTTDTAVQDMPEFTEGICGDEVVILCDGQRMSISNILAQLNAGAAAEARVKELERQNPVVLPEYKFCPAEYQGSLLWSETEIWNKAIDASKAAIEASGGIVKDGE